MSTDGRLFPSDLEPGSGCFSCDAELAKIIDTLGEDLPDGRRQLAAQSAGLAICANECREGCPIFNGLYEVAEHAVVTERAKMLDTLEAELSGLRGERYNMALNSDEKGVVYFLSLFDINAGIDRTHRIIESAWDNLLGFRKDRNEKLTKLLDGSNLFIANEADGNLVGALELTEIGDDIAEIVVMGVNSEHTGAGIGAGLVRLAEKFAKGNSKLWLQVYPMVDSIDFYKKQGFYQPDPDDAMLRKFLL